MSGTHELHGIIPPLVTPTRCGRIDPDGVHRLVDHVIDGGVHGVFVAGTTGEYPLIREEDWPRLVEATVAATAGRAPVLAGVTKESTAEAIALSEEAGRLGVNYVVATTPSYYRHTQAELIAHFAALADASPVPILLYNIPQNTGNALESSTIVELSQLPNVVGLKDSFGRLEHLRVLIDEINNDDFRIFLGSDTLGDVTLTVGAHGIVPSVANVAPALVVAAWNAAVAGAAVRSAELHKQVGLIARLYAAGEAGSSGSYIAALKYAMELIGVPVGDVFPPIESLSGDGRSRVMDVLRQCGLIDRIAAD